MNTKTLSAIRILWPMRNNVPALRKQLRDLVKQARRGN